LIPDIEPVPGLMIGAEAEGQDAGVHYVVDIKAMGYGQLRVPAGTSQEGEIAL
jgi:hypothetical protein